MRKYLPDLISVIVVSLIIFIIAWNIPFDIIRLFISQNPLLGALVFIFFMILSTVVPPVTIFPLIPFVGVVLGPFATMIYCVIGWTIGSVMSFWIARHLGRPFLARYISLDKIDEWGNKIPEKNEFLALLLLRMATPVDVLSYAVGLFCRIKFWKYAIASFFGVIPFSYVLAYGYDIFLFEDNKILFVTLFMVLLVLGGLIISQKRLNSKNK
ncbi:MAG: TVP38/TMEM64 family protein [Candidatus Pacebacteria bacterium]|nr:TVP38/TMEM64 family protein [Candidatus Paceibacterota bacterium]